MLFKLAVGNVRKSARDFGIYFVTLALGVAVFYAFNTISGQTGFLSEDSREVVQSLGLLMRYVTVFLACILGFLMVYANNYLVRRRKRELGLYQVLGMTRGQVSRVLVLETLLASAASFIVGMALGVLISQLLVFVTAALFHDAVTQFSFTFSLSAMLFTLACFGLMFLVMLIMNLKALRRVRLVELMGAARANETVRVRSLFATILCGCGGVGLIALAYVRLLHDGLPTAGASSMPAFYLTTLMVVVGTILFYFALSGIILRIGQARHAHYYRGLNMFTLRQLSARANTVSLSLAVVSLVLFLAITSVSSGMAICSIMDGMAEKTVPYDASTTVYYSSKHHSGANLPVIDIHTELAKRGINVDEIAKTQVQRTTYAPASIDGGEVLSLGVLGKLTGVPIPDGMSDTITDAEQQGDMAFPLMVTSASDYNATREAFGLAPVDLNGHYLLLCTSGGNIEDFYARVMQTGTPLTLAGQSLTPASCGLDTSLAAADSNVVGSPNMGSIVVPDEVVAHARPYSCSLNLRYSVPVKQGDAFIKEKMPNFEAEDRNSADWVFASNAEGETATYYQTVTRTTGLALMVGLSGAIAYLALYLEFVLVIACAAIIAIQQLSAAADAAPSFRLLSELGVSRKMAMGSLRTQILAFFALPLPLALGHSVVALSQVVKLGKTLGLSNMLQPALISAVLFVLIYGMYFAVTYSTARQIVTMRTRQ